MPLQSGGNLRPSPSRKPLTQPTSRTRTEAVGPIPQVVDANALIDPALASPRGIRVGRAVSDNELCVPELLKFIVTSTLARLAPACEIESAAAQTAHQRSGTPAEPVSHELLRDFRLVRADVVEELVGRTDPLCPPRRPWG